MPAKLSMEKIIKIRKEIRNGKSRRRIAKETGLSVDTVCKYGKNITSGKINDELKSIIRKEVISGKTKKQVANEYGISYSKVLILTNDINRRTVKLTDEKIKLIQKQVRGGKTKKEVAVDMGISYWWILRYTKGIPTVRYISESTRKKIRELIHSGKSNEDIAEELNISLTTVKIHSVDDKYYNCKYSEVPQHIIEEIRIQVKSGKSKLQVAKDVQVSYAKVKRYTKGLQGGTIKRKPRLSKKIINKIRREVQSGKPKMQVSRELNIFPRLIYYHTMDIITGHPRNLGIAGNTLKLLKEIMENGYAKPSKEYQYNNYRKLRSRFPNIRRVEMYGKVIYFIQENSDLAMRIFLEELKKKIISYQELQQIINVFDGKMVRKDRKKYVRFDK